MNHKQIPVFYLTATSLKTGVQNGMGKGRRELGINIYIYVYNIIYTLLSECVKFVPIKYIPS